MHVFMPQKAVKIDVPLDSSPSTSTDVHRALDSSPSASTNVPEVGDSPSASTSFGSSFASSAPSLSEEEASAPVFQQMPSSAQHRSRHQEEHDGLDSAVEAAMQAFKEAWYAFAVERDVGNKHEDKREDRASRVTEGWVAERYEDMKSTLLGLLPHLGPMQSVEQGEQIYQAVEFVGRKPPHHIVKTSGEDDAEEDLAKVQLEWLRSEPRARAWEAACAVMSVISMRKEKTWIEANETTQSLEAQLKKLPLCRSKRSARRKDAIRMILEKECSTGCGYFSNYLPRPTTTLRIAFIPGVPRPMPASLMITARLPLFEALQSLDADQPLQGEAQSRKWCSAAGRQFAFQLADLSIDERTNKRTNRVPVATLQPDPALRALLRSRKPAVLLEVVAALAPRDVARQQGLSEIVKAELAQLMQECKRRGEAVVLCLGGAEPHALAQKVYLRQPIGDYGLKCGYLRWRESADAPWARETSWSERSCLCLQMP
jgi:hypothetical protein